MYKKYKIESVDFTYLKNLLYNKEILKIQYNPEDSDPNLYRLTKEPYFKFNIMSFNLSLKPKINNLLISYKQFIYTLLQDPKNRNYIMNLKNLRWGFDYPLYPAYCWRKDKDFNLKISVAIPNIVEKGWFVDKPYKIKTWSNLDLKETYNQEKRIYYYTGSFDTFPDDFFSLIFRKYQ